MKRATVPNGRIPDGTAAIRPAADVRRASDKVERTAKKGANRARDAIIAFKNR